MCNWVIFWSQCSLLIIKDFLFWKTHSFCPWTWQEPFSCLATQAASHHHGWLRLALWKLPFCYIREDDWEHRPILDCEFQMPEPNKYQKVEAPPEAHAWRVLLGPWCFICAHPSSKETCHACCLRWMKWEGRTWRWEWVSTFGLRQCNLWYFVSCQGNLFAWKIHCRI